MADEEKEQEPEQKSEEQKPNTDSDKGSGFGLYTWLIMAAIVIAGSMGGFALSQLLAGGKPTAPLEAENIQEEDQAPESKSFDDLVADSAEVGKSWYYELEPVIANLDEPGITRYLRSTITLELSPEMNQDKGVVFLEEKTLLMRDWLTSYIAGLSLERIRGTRNISRIKKEIRDNFNELLFPESKPFIQSVFLKDFAVQ